MSIEVGSMIWLKNPQANNEETWIPAVVLSLEPTTQTFGTIKVKTESGASYSLKFPWGESESDEIKPRNIVSHIDKDDLIDLPFLNEPEILLNLKNRFEQSKIFTNAGPILITINPFDEVIPTESCIDVVRRFVEEMKLQSNRNFAQSGKKINHSILISGESGSGKTESFKLLLNLLGKQATNNNSNAAHQTQSSRQEWFSKAFLTNKALESFGNAMTMHTVNSTRFGKLVDLTINPSGEMINFTTRTYLLEFSRTTNQQLKERNFNIFYQILAGASPEERKRWKLTENSSAYHYTNQGQLANTADQATLQAWDKMDATNYNQIKADLLKIGLDKTQLSDLLDAIVGIIHLGEIQYTDRNDLSGGSLIVRATNANDSEPVVLAAQFLGISPNQLEELTTVRSFISRGERIIRPLNTAAAKIARDAIAKAIYRGVFDWIVHFFNSKLQQSIKPEELQSSSSIILVDIFGFDSFAYNSMDQLCINYSNEVLQQLFNFNVFKRDIILYQQEGINYDELKFSDNKDNIELISNGLFKVLDDQCRLPDPTDKRFVAQLYKDFQSHKLFSATPGQQLVSKFTIQHFSGAVEYTANDFIMKNLDNLPTDTGKILLTSKNTLLQSLALGEYQNASGGVRRRSSLIVDSSNAGNDTKTSARSSTTAPSFVSQVKSDLQLLLKDVEPTELHYVRCLKPYNPDRNWQFTSNNVANNRNSFPKNRPINFSNIKITEQLRYGGVLEAIKITRTKFRAHMTYPDFFTRYRMVVHNIGDTSFDQLKITNQTDLKEARNIVKKMLDTIATAKTNKLQTTTTSAVTPTSSKKQQQASSGQRDLRQTLSKSISRREIDNVITSASGKHSSGKVLEINRIQLGATLIFLKVREYEILEALRNASIVAHVIVVQTIFRRLYRQQKYLQMKKAIPLILRIWRGAKARIYVRRIKLLQAAVIILQQEFRSKRLIRKATKIQRAYRCYYAKKYAKELKEKRDRLLSAYGPLVLAREMRVKRRKLFTGISDASNGVAFIQPLEARFKRYAEEEIALVKTIMQLVSRSKLEDDQMQGELEFDKLVKELSMQIAILPDDSSFKNHCISHLKEIRLAEHILKLRKLTDNTLLGKVMGASLWKSLNKYSGDIAKVNLTPNHGLFIRINSTIEIIQQLKTQGNTAAESLEREREKVRTKGIKSSSPVTKFQDQQGDLDLFIATITQQIKACKKLCTLFDIVEKYYKHFIVTFIKEYGSESSFRGNYDTEKRYLKALIEVVRAAKKYIPIPPQQQGSQGNGQVRPNVYRVGNCPLKVDWREALELPKVDLSMLTINNSNNQKDDSSDLIKILLSLELKKREFNTDNLRILEFSGVGYQYMPQDPAIAYALNLFTQLLGGNELTARRIVKLAGTRQLAGKVTFYQAMQGFTKTSLLDVLYNPVHVEQLDSFSFSLSVLSCCVLGLLNLQPNHVMVNYENKDTPQQRVKITGFNPDAILSAQFLDYSNPSRYKIHQRNINVLFFLPQMDEPVDQTLRAFLTSSPYIVEEIIISWLRDLYDQNRRYLALKSAGLNAEDFKQLHVPLLLPAGASIEIRRRLNRICRLLRSSTAEREGNVATHYVTLSKIVETLFPAIGNYYTTYRNNSDFKENVENIEGVVSYAYMYHQALDNERRMGKKGSDSPPMQAKKSVGGIFRKSFYKNELENGNNQGGDGNESDDSSVVSFGSSKSSQSHKSIDRMPSAGFNYDQIYLESHQRIPGVDDEEQEELGMNSAEQPFDENGERILRIESSRSQFMKSNSSELDAPMDRSRLYKLTGPDGASAFQFDRIYENKSYDATNAAASAASNDSFVQYPPLPFQMIQKRITMKSATPKMDASINQYSFDEGSESSNPNGNNGNGNNTAVATDEEKAIRRKSLAGAGGSNILTPISPLNRAPSGNANKNNNNFSNNEIIPKRSTSFFGTGNKGLPLPPSDSMDDNASYAAYQTGDYDASSNNMSKHNSAVIKYESPPEEFKKGPKKTMSKYAAELVGDEQRRTPLTRTIEEEGFEFFNSLDWRDFAHERPLGQAEEFCEMIGRDLTFLSSIWLNHINDWQFKALFRYWVKSNANRSLLVPGLKAITKEVILRYSSKEEMANMQNCKGLSKLLRRFHIDLKFAVLSSENDEEEDVVNDDNRRKKSTMKINTNNLDQYDIYAFTPDVNTVSTDSQRLSTHSASNFNIRQIASLDENEFLDEFIIHDLTPEQEIISRKLHHALWSCLNKIKNSELEVMDDDIRHVREIIKILSKDEHVTMITPQYLKSFTRLLVEYPILSPVAIMIAEKKGFARDLTILHQLIASKYVNKYVEVIFCILYHHPEVLVKPDYEGYLPCDRIKKINPRHLRNLKYVLLTKFINFTAGPLTRSFQSINKGIFSTYRGDEELIILAALYDFPAIESELKMKKFELYKKDATTNSLFLLMKLLLIERDSLLSSTMDRDNVWKIYQLLIKTLTKRMTKGEFGVKECEEYLWKSIDMNLIPAHVIKDKKISMKEFETTSKVYQDLMTNWSSTSKVRQSYRVRKLSSNLNNPISKYRSIGPADIARTNSIARSGSSSSSMYSPGIAVITRTPSMSVKTGTSATTPTNKDAGDNKKTVSFGAAKSPVSPSNNNNKQGQSKSSSPMNSKSSGAGRSPVNNNSNKPATPTNVNNKVATPTNNNPSSNSKPAGAYSNSPISRFFGGNK